VIPAYTRELIARRNNGDHPTEVYVAVGWPSQWLQTFVKTSPLARDAAIVATPETRAYDFSALRGLSCCVWFERDHEEARAHEIASQIIKYQPNRLFTLNASTGAQTWHRVASELRVAA
jgi:hypothetical protein